MEEKDKTINPNKFYPKTPEETLRKQLKKKGKKIKSLPDHMQNISRE